MSTTEIDYLTRDFYKAISFDNSTPPDFEQVKMLFYGHGILINNSMSKPIAFTAETYIESIESQIADRNLEQFMEREIYSKTEVFGKVAQRISVYEYNFSDHELHRLPRGVNFVQFAQIEGNWRILSMAWFDENENHIIPAAYLH